MGPRLGGVCNTTHFSFDFTKRATIFNAVFKMKSNAVIAEYGLVVELILLCNQIYPLTTFTISSHKFLYNQESIF